MTSFAVYVSGRRVSKTYPHRLQAIVDAIMTGRAGCDRTGTVMLFENVEIKETEE